MIKLYVIIPDKASGDAFNKVLRSKGIDTEYQYYKIHPRVIDNKITTSLDVVNDMNNIFKTFSDKTRSVVIACNTLQIWLKNIDDRYKQNVKVYTTFEACRWRFKNLRTLPLWLGTTPLVERTVHFPTLISSGKSEIQNLVQELIWRLKMLYGDDISTASLSVREDKSNKKIQRLKILNLKKEIMSNLKELKIKNVILGCTELPMIFTKSKENGINFFDPAEVLAGYIKAQSVEIVFAGGTISSLADKNGTRIGGRVFNLLEKLSEKIPGSYKNVNITKSDVVYSGLSENLTEESQKKILNKINDILKTGISRIVITHGTDAMEQTARFLNKRLASKLKRLGILVVLTGSNHDAGSLKTDAWDNLVFAINHSCAYDVGGVYVAFNHKFIPAGKVEKLPFLGKDMSYESRSSIQFKRYTKKFNEIVKKVNMSLEKELGSHKETSFIIHYSVNKIVKNHDKILKVINTKKPRVILFKLYHSGTANTTDPNSSVETLISKLTKMGIVCFGATETGEPTDLKLYETSVVLRKAGLIPLYDMLFPVALHKLYLLNVNLNKLSNEEIVKKMLTPVAGEITLR